MDTGVGIWIWIVLGIFLLLLEGFFSGSEMAFINLDPIKIKSDSKLYFFIKHPERLLATTLLGTNLCIITNSSIFAYVVKKYTSFPEELATVLFLSPVILIFGETIPKSIARARPLSFARLVMPVFWMVYGLMLPFTSVFIKFLNKINGDVSRDYRFSREDISLIVNRSEDVVLDQQERKLIRRIIELKDIRVREVMKPIVQVISLEKSDPVYKAIRFSHHCGCTRFPVYRENVYNVVGILSIYDLVDANPSDSVSKYMRKGMFVPELKSVWNLLLEMQSEQISMAVVVDEYGAAVGIVTIEDIVEEIVGEIEDEFDIFSSRGEKIVKISDKEFMVSGDLEIDILKEEMGVELPKNNMYETVNGLLTFVLDRIPREGDKVEINGYELEVVEARDRVAKKVLVRVINGRERKDTN